MVVVLRSHPVTGSRLAKWLCHTDPEGLVRLAAEHAAGPDEAARDRASTAFSHVLDNLCINGSWKRSLPGRLRGSEAALCRLLTAGGPGAALDVLDVGASDGITTVELLSALRRAGVAGARLRLADLTLTLQRYRAGSLVEYRTARGEPVLVRLGWLGLRLPRSPRRFDRVSTLLARLYLKLGPVRRRLAEAETILLVNPATRSDPDLEVIELDVLVRNDALSGGFDGIRASNVLNKENFTRDQLLRAIGTLHAYLREGGYLLISRNQIGRTGETERGSVWQRRESRFIPVEGFGGGSELAEVVAAFAGPDPQHPARAASAGAG